MFCVLLLLINHIVTGVPDVIGPSSRILSGDPILTRAPAPSSEIRSSDPVRLELEESSRLVGSRGMRANVRIRLRNLDPRERVFHMEVTEDTRGVSRLLESASSSRLAVPGEGAKVLTLNLRIPQRISNGHRSVIKVKAVPLDANRIVTPEVQGFEIEISFYVSDTFNDSIKPQISDPSPSIMDQCSEVEDCSSKTWRVVSHIKDEESGIRSMETDPFIGPNSGSLEFSHEPYIRGDPQEIIKFTLTGSCCETNPISLRVRDGFGNENNLSLGPEADESTGLNGVEIGLIVLCICILLLLLIGLLVIFIIRRKRAANLEEIRRFPS